MVTEGSREERAVLLARLHAAEQRYRLLERRELERTAELESANRELEAFAYSVSHDLRMPLRAIAGFTAILLNEHETELSSAVLDRLHAIMGSAQRMEKLIDGLLTFSRLSRQPLSKQKLEMEKLVCDAWSDLQPELHGRLVTLEVAALPVAEGDATLLHQVWANLLSNALKFTRRRATARIEVGSCSDARENIYFLRDNGAGFDMKYAAKLFGVFQRLHRQEDFEGTGIGLYTVQRIVRRHGGRAWAQGKVGVGATFYFSLPK